MYKWMKTHPKKAPPLCPTGFGTFAFAKDQVARHLLESRHALESTGTWGFPVVYFMENPVQMDDEQGYPFNLGKLQTMGPQDLVVSMDSLFFSLCLMV